jgi:hypothetical protein
MGRPRTKWSMGAGVVQVVLDAVQPRRLGDGDDVGRPAGGVGVRFHDEFVDSGE